MAAVTTEQSVAALYTAIFNRAPDQAGLDFWTTQIKGGASFATIAAGFAQHEVFTTGIGALPNADYVAELYTNILGSAGDAAGIAYWIARLDAGESKASVVASFVEGSLTIDLAALLAAGSLTQVDYDLALVRQQTLTNKADVGIDFANTLGAASNLNPATVSTSKAALEADPIYKASQAAIANVDSTAASVQTAKNAISVAASSADPSQVLLGQTFTLTAGMAAQVAGELPAYYSLTDANVDLGVHTVAEVAPATAAAQAVVDGASNKADLTLTATYSLNDTLANIQAADAAVVTGATGYSLTDANVDLGATPLSVATAQADLAAAQLVIDNSSNAIKPALAATYTLADSLINLAAPANADVVDGAVTYELTDTALTAATVVDATIAGLATAQAAAIAVVHADSIVFGATNGATIAVTNGAYTLADTLANLVAADSAVVSGAESYTLSDSTGLLANLSV
ncbi:DUF4214 domain-containing protein, partial [Pseudomonas veronii]